MLLDNHACAFVSVSQATHSSAACCLNAARFVQLNRIVNLASVCVQAAVKRQTHEAARLQRRLDKQTVLRRSLEAHLKSVWSDFVEAARARDAQATELSTLRDASASMKHELGVLHADGQAAEMDAKLLLVPLSSSCNLRTSCSAYVA